MTDLAEAPPPAAAPPAGAPPLPPVTLATQVKLAGALPAADVAEAPPERFLAAIPPQVAGGGPLPLAYGLMVRDRSKVPVMRWAESDHYRTCAYVCRPGGKPISRCFGGAG